jgi:hypothetical protein
MTGSTNIKYHSQEIREAHALAIGKIVMAWNEYHEILGQIFAKLFGARNWAAALSAWQALENDRAQRSMLAAVARIKLKPTDRAYKEITWIVEKTNQIVSDQRNLGIHTPLMSLTGLDGIPKILPQTMFGNKRAAKLHGADLLLEFAHYENQIRKMLIFAVAIDFAITPRRRRRGRVTWPHTNGAKD